MPWFPTLRLCDGLLDLTCCRRVWAGHPSLRTARLRPSRTWLCRWSFVGQSRRTLEGWPDCLDSMHWWLFGTFIVLPCPRFETSRSCHPLLWSWIWSPLRSWPSNAIGTGSQQTGWVWMICRLPSCRLWQSCTNGRTILSLLCLFILSDVPIIIIITMIHIYNHLLHFKYILCTIYCNLTEFNRLHIVSLLYMYYICIMIIC